MKIKSYDNFDIWQCGDHTCEFKPGTTVFIEDRFNCLYLKVNHKEEV